MKLGRREKKNQWLTLKILQQPLLMTRWQKRRPKNKVRPQLKMKKQTVALLKMKTWMRCWLGPLTSKSMN